MNAHSAVKWACLCCGSRSTVSQAAGQRHESAVQRSRLSIIDTIPYAFGGTLRLVGNLTTIKALAAAGARKFVIGHRIGKTRGHRCSPKTLRSERAMPCCSSGTPRRYRTVPTNSRSTFPINTARNCARRCRRSRSGSQTRRPSSRSPSCHGRTGRRSSTTSS